MTILGEFLQPSDITQADGCNAATIGTGLIVHTNAPLLAVQLRCHGVAFAAGSHEMLVSNQNDTGAFGSGGAIGMGGTSVLACPSGQLLSGLRYFDAGSDLISGIASVCMPALGGPVSISEAAGPSGGAGDFVDVVCPAGRVVTGLIADVNPSASFVPVRLSIRCN